MSVSIQTYEQVALEDDDEQWELVCGRLRKKPGMTTEHIDAMMNLAAQLHRQLDPHEFAVRVNIGQVSLPTGSFYVPDVFVVSRAAVERGRRERPRRLEVHVDPLPLVVEVWSPSTGDYDVEVKLQQYQLRGDAEIWRIHPYERTLIAWRRQPDGTYSETLYHGGTIEPGALPGVRIEIDALFP
ncbi:MAG: Uma2 family endonuclease [Dehalococcoidia bacterium]